MRRAAGISEPQTAPELLRSDHRQVEKLFKAFKSAKSTEDRQSLAREICTALKLHMRIEEEIFYPAFVDATGDKSLHAEAVVEHESAKQLIGQIETSVVGDPFFEARVNVLAEMIKHHVKEEERFNGMFAKARRARMDLRALGILLEARRQELSGTQKKRPARSRFEAPPEMASAAALARSKRRAPARRAPV